jgi:hypothetical protein
VRQKHCASWFALVCHFNWATSHCQREVLVNMSMEEKLAALVVKNKIAPLDSSSLSAATLIQGDPMNIIASGFCWASMGTWL